jgi:hypothetical protein
MTVQPGSNNTINTVTGVVAIMDIGALTPAQGAIIPPKNIMFRDSVTGNICLTDGTHSLQYAIDNPIMSSSGDGGDFTDAQIDTLCDTYLQ